MFYLEDFLTFIVNARLALLNKMKCQTSTVTSWGWNSSMVMELPALKKGFRRLFDEMWLSQLMENRLTPSLVIKDSQQVT